MLYQMYVHYAEDKGWKVTVLDLVPGEGIGLDRATIQIEGRYAYGMLRSEIGIHRLVRISPTSTPRSAARPPSPRWRCCRSSPTTSRWTKPRRRAVDVYRPAVRAASA